jgi:ABC-2 type transport system ATP-binding protein
LGAVITLEGLSKRYGDTTTVDDLTVSPTGFLGPNGTGRSTNFQYGVQTIPSAATR